MMNSEVERRYKQVQYIAWLVRTSCDPTPFVYRRILRKAEEERRNHAKSPSDPPCPCCEPEGDDCREEGGAAADSEGRICGRGERAPFCIACINWVRRLSKSKELLVPSPSSPDPRKKRRRATRGVIPLDNLLLFVHDPGHHKEPDKRTMFRLLQNASMEYTGPDSSVRIQNPYLCFTTHIFSQVLTLFKRKYFRSYRLDCKQKARWKDMKSSKSSSHSVNGCEIVSSTYKYQQGKMMDNNLEMINDIIRIWWKCHGMPSVLQDRVSAKYVRRMLRVEKPC